MRIAIIGGGISGLACAWGLRDQHDIVLFEAADWLGGHTHTVDVELAGQNYAVDTGFIVFNDATYPNFIRLLDQLGLQGQATNMSFSVATGGREYASHDLPALFADAKNLFSPRHWAMLKDILRFNREAPGLKDSDDTRTLAEYLKDESYSKAFAQDYIFPLCAAIWSAPLQDAGSFPAEHFARFFYNHGLLQLRDRPQWRVVPGGSREYVRRMQAKLTSDIRLSTPVQSVSRGDDGVHIKLADGTEHFDAVIFACHSDQALALLAEASVTERNVLGALPYTDNDVVLHTDASLLPRHKRAWASWNFRVGADPSAAACITYHMNRLQGLEAPEEFCVSLNQSGDIAADKIIERYRYAHPVYNPASNAARAKRELINGHNSTWYCGAYWYNGFHEDGARSALDVCQALGGGW